MNTANIREAIALGRTVLGVELGSTRIKAVLVDEEHNPIAAGNHDWENRLENNVWTYSIDDVWTGLQDAYQNLVKDVKEKYDVELTTFGAMGFSAMMHGYMAFDKDGKLLAPFRTWRNTMTGPAAAELTELFSFNIPQRWSIAHLRQAMLNGEDHIPQIAYLTTLSGYVHWMLTGQKVMGVGEASGMFPIDSETNNYDAGMVEKFNKLIAPAGLPWTLEDILPKVLVAGEDAGVLTAEGAKLLDVTGKLQPGIPMCPPEGDAGTGMTATNSVAKRTGNVSAGTSVFAMVVLEKALEKVHTEIDMVTTPSGRPVAMVHCNNCTSDLNAWVGLFGEFAKLIGVDLNPNDLYGSLYREALKADKDCGGLLSYNYFSGEHITGFEEGRPLFARTPDSRFTLANFMRTHLYSALSVLKLGLNILLDEEKVQIDRMYGHGGLFKTKGVGQSIMAAAINAPVSVMETAGEGGAWGVALLAAYMKNKAEGETLEAYLSDRVFAGKLGEEMQPDPADVAGFGAFIERYAKGLPIEKAAVETM
ncbi:MAG: FGGY-family carbohydrate kinase [Clostridia bacterium]|nr:FGGY-family carbohydrate kinase [Clostridia bacterium]